MFSAHVHGIWMVCEKKNLNVFENPWGYLKNSEFCGRGSSLLRNPSSLSTECCQNSVSESLLKKSDITKKTKIIWPYFFLAGRWDYPLWQMSQRLLPDGYPEESGPSQDARNHRSRRVEVSGVRSKTNLRTTGSLLGRLAGNFPIFSIDEIVDFSYITKN